MTLLQWIRHYEARDRADEECWRRFQERMEREPLFCPICYQKLTMYSGDGDWLCEEHSFVRPVSLKSLNALRDRLRELEVLA